jgi:hypothetical protein
MPAAGDRLTVDFLQAKLSAVTRHWPGLAQMPAKVVGSERALPEAVRAKLREMRAKGQQAIPRAVYVPNDGLYFVAPNIASTKEALLALAEEAIGHHGLRAVMGPQFDALLDRVADERSADVAAMAREYGLDMERTEQRREAAEEYLAHQARLDTRETWFQGIVQAIRQMLRKLGVRLRLSDGDIRELLAASNRYVTQGDARGALRARGRFGEGATGRNQDARFMFAGRKAKGAELRSLVGALNRAKVGEDREAIRQETGWFQGEDGKWRFEINDDQAAFKVGVAGDRVSDILPEYGKRPLGEILDHPALFAAYPDLASLPVRGEPRKDGGSYDSEKRVLSLNARMYLDDPRGQDALSVLLHEIQHGIQYVEGFAIGGSPGQFAFDEGMDQSSRQDAGQRIKEFERQALDGQTLYEITEEAYDLVADDAITEAEAQARIDQANAKLEAAMAADPFYQNDLKRARQPVLSAGERYRRLAGEAEARNTQARQRMTAEQRRATPPSQTADVAADDVIVMFNGKEVANAPRPSNAGLDPVGAGAGGQVRGAGVSGVSSLSERLRQKGPDTPHEAVYPNNTYDDKRYLIPSIKLRSGATIDFAYDSARKVHLPPEHAKVLKEMMRLLVSTLQLDRDGVMVTFESGMRGRGVASGRDITIKLEVLRQWIRSGLSDKVTLGEMAELLSHELVHVWQEQRGALGRDAERRLTWDGQARDANGRLYEALPHHARPWEAEAIDLQGVLAKRIIDDLVGQQIVDPSLSPASTKPKHVQSITEKEQAIEQQTGIDPVSERATATAAPDQPVFPIEESRRNREARERMGLDVLMTVDAGALQRVFERERGEALMHKAMRGDNLRELLDQGTAIDAYPVVGAQYGFNIDDGRHRVGVAAERGMRITIATNKDSEAALRTLLAEAEQDSTQADPINPIDADYFAAIERGDMAAVERMVQAAAEKAGVPIINEEGVTAYRVRRTAPPKKTQKAYKLFRVKKGQPGEVFALFVGANDPLPQDVWLDAIAGPQAGTNKSGGAMVKSKLGPLAYRPGWHAGDVPLATHIGAKQSKTGDIIGRKEDEVWAEVEMADDNPKWAELARQNGTLANGQFSMAKADVKEMPVDGMYRYKTNPNMTGQWIISGSMKINRILSEQEVNQILQGADMPTMPWTRKTDAKVDPYVVAPLDLARWGLETNPAVNQRKLLDPITYDDNGQIIPLSQRFDRTKADVRFSLADIDTHQRTLKEELTRRLKALGDTTSTAERTMMKALGSLTVRMLADVSQKVLPSAKRFVQAMSAYQTERNKMVDQATRTAHDMLKHPGKENRRLMALMNDSTVDGIDASLSAFVPKVADVTQGRMQIRALRNQAAQIKRQLQGDVTGLDVAALMQERESALKRARQIGADIRSDTKLAPKHKALHARFKALPEWAQVMYTKVRDDYQGMSERMEKAIMDTALGAQLDAERKILEQIEASGLEDDAKETLRKAVHDGLYALDANNDQLAVSVKPEARKAIQDAGLETQARTVMLGHLARGLTNKQAMIARVRSEFEAGRVEGVYFPLQRFGRFYAVFERQANDEDGQPKVDTNGEPVMVKGFSMFESEYQMKLETPDIVAEGWTLKEQGYKVEAMKDLDGASEGFVADVVSKLVDEGEANAADHVYQMYLASLPFLSARKHFIHRKKTAGYTNDLPRTYASNMAHLANQIARMEATPAFKGALNGMRQESKVGEDHARAEQYLDEFQQRYEWIMNPGGSKLSSQITALGFLWHLGVSPAAALVNLTQTAMVSFPEYAAKYGFRKSGAALTRSMLEVLKMRTKGFKGRRDYDTWGSLTEDERAAFRHWHDIGAIDVTNVHSLMGLAEGDSTNYSPRVAKVMEASGFLFQEAEVINREATLLAGYRLAREAGQSVEQARESAAEATWNSHGDYSSANRARWVQGNTARVLFQFKQYSQIITYYLARNAWNALKGADAQTRTEARKRMAGVIGMTGLLAGSQGLPYAMTAPMFMMANIVQALFGDDDDEDWDAETAWRAWLADMGLAGVAIDRGAVNALTGVDLANRVKLSDLWLRDQDDQLEGKNLYRSYLEMLAGPVVGGVGSSVFEAMRLAEEGHYQRAAEKATPKFIKDVLTAARFGMEGGANNLKGEPITDLTPFEVFMKASGFNADRLSAMYEMNSQAKTLEQRILQRRTTLIAAYGMAALNGDVEGVQRAKQKIAAYNAKKPAMPIDQKSLRSSLKARERYRETSDSGIYLNPKLGYVRELTRVPL